MACNRGVALRGAASPANSFANGPIPKSQTGGQGTPFKNARDPDGYQRVWDCVILGSRRPWPVRRIRSAKSHNGSQAWEPPLRTDASRIPSPARRNRGRTPNPYALLARLFESHAGPDGDQIALTTQPWDDAGSLPHTASASAHPGEAEKPYGNRGPIHEEHMTSPHSHPLVSRCKRGEHRLEASIKHGFRDRFGRRGSATKRICQASTYPSRASESGCHVRPRPAIRCLHPLAPLRPPSDRVPDASSAQKSRESEDFRCCRVVVATRPLHHDHCWGVILVSAPPRWPMPVSVRLALLSSFRRGYCPPCAKQFSQTAPGHRSACPSSRWSSRVPGTREARLVSVP
jgi:hypothetical protein